LVGYCWEKNHLALVYEYMSQGNLYDHLRGKHAAVEILNWGTRVRIVLEAAQGLDYLHNGCSPPIIHRDVKSSNILLGRNLQAKIADMGLSRLYLSDILRHTYQPLQLARLVTWTQSTTSLEGSLRAATCTASESSYLR